MIQIGKGETKTFKFTIKSLNNAVSTDDTILFAIEDKENYLKFSDSKKIEDLVIEDEKYVFNVVLTSAFTSSLKEDFYYYDLTLIDSNGNKTCLTRVKGIEILNSVGASI